MDERKKPLWPWLVATVFALPVLYVASSGPTRIIAYRGPRGFTGEQMADWWLTVYAPLEWSANHKWGWPLNRYWDLFRRAP